MNSSVAAVVAILCIAIANAGFVKRAVPYSSITPGIPQNILLDCYGNKTLFERDNRFPSTIENLIALIQKVERYQMRPLSIRDTAKLILKRFRFDGIAFEEELNPSLIQFTTNNAEPESDIYKMTMIYDMIPGDRDDFPEDSLTNEEKCSLHFMLSHTVNITKREDETDEKCNRLSSEWRERRNVDDSELEIKNEEDDQPPLDDDKGDTDDIKEEEQKDEERKEEEIPKDDVARSYLSAQYRSKVDLERQSRCPVELGVVSTPWGPITPGTVIAAIAAGMEVQDKSVSELAEVPKDTPNEIAQARVTNWWAATLAGDIAQVAVFQVPRSTTPTAPKLGGAGAWNSTHIPRWYFLKDLEDFEMTSAEIRAGIDGALIANKIRDWNSGNLRLSQVLEMYYSEKGIGEMGEYRACKRKENFRNTDKLNAEELNLQSLSFAYALHYKTKMSPLQDQQVADFVSSTISQLSSAVDRINDPPCETDWEAADFTLLRNNTAVDLYLVINYNDMVQSIEPNQYDMWDFVGELARQIDVSWWGSSIGIFSAKDGQELIALNATKNAAELVSKLRFIPQWTNGLEVSEVLAKLREHFIERAAREEELNVAGTNGTVVLFVTSERVGDSEKNNAKRQKQDLKYDFPDVKIMFASSIPNSEFSGLVDNYNEDVIKIETGNLADQAHVVVETLSRVPSRLIYPRCTSNSVYYGQSESSSRFIGYVSPGYAKTFKIDPKYFFSSDTLKLKIDKTSMGNIRVCYAYNNQNLAVPQGQHPSGGRCVDTLKGGSVEFNFNEPCGSDDDRESCRPIYISVQGIDSRATCNEPSCRYLDEIKFTFSHDGMRCNGAISLFLSKQLLLLPILLILLKSFSVNLC